MLHVSALSLISLITEVTRAPSIAVDKNYRKIYQRKPPPPNTKNNGHLTPYRQELWFVKGIPNAIAQKL